MGPWSCQKGSFLLLLRIVDDLFNFVFDFCMVG